MKIRRRVRSHVASGFSMVELLTVIAIIAILAAITFPVANTVRENARRSACMSNMRQITMALKQYQLDNRRYPEYLFGPADPAKSMQQMAAELSAGTATADGLYPEYIKSLDVYNCPNNTENRTPTTLDQALAAKWVSAARSVDVLPFYKYSSYEANPAIVASTMSLDNTTYKARYSRLWAEPLDTPPADPAVRAIYSRQLFWKNPPDDVYVTMCTYHVPKGKVIVAFLNGQTKVLDTEKLRNFAVSGDSPLDFEMFRFTPND